MSYPVVVTGPDGATHNFPDGTTEEVIKKVMRRHYGEPKTKTIGQEKAAPFDPQSDIIPTELDIVSSALEERDVYEKRPQPAPKPKGIRDTASHLMEKAGDAISIEGNLIGAPSGSPSDLTKGLNSVVGAMANLPSEFVKKPVETSYDMLLRPVEDAASGYAGAVTKTIEGDTKEAMSELSRSGQGILNTQLNMLGVKAGRGAKSTLDTTRPISRGEVKAGIMDATAVTSDVANTTKFIERLLINSGVPRDVVSRRLPFVVDNMRNLSQTGADGRLSLARLIEGEFAEEFPDVRKNIRGFLLHRGMDTKDGGQTIVTGAIDDLRGTQGQHIKDRINSQLGSQSSSEAEAIVKANLQDIGRNQIEASLKVADNASPEAQQLADKLLKDVTAKTILARRAFNEGKTTKQLISENPVEAAHWVQSDLNKAAQSATGFEKVDLDATVSAYQKMLDDIAPGYREARANYAHEAGVRDALGYTDEAGKYQKGFGDDFIPNARKDRSTENMAQTYGGMSSEQAAAADLNLRDNLTDVMRTGRADGLDEFGRDVAGARLNRIQTEGVTNALPRVLGERGQSLSDDLRRAISERQFNVDIDPRTGSNTMNKAEAMATGPVNISKGLGRLSDTTGGMTPTMLADAALMATGNLPVATMARSGIPGVSKIFQPPARRQNALAELLLSRPAAYPPRPPPGSIPSRRILPITERPVSSGAMLDDEWRVEPGIQNRSPFPRSDEQGAVSIEAMAPIMGGSVGAIAGYGDPDLDGDGVVTNEEQAEAILRAFSVGGLGAVSGAAIARGPKALSELDHSKKGVFAISDVTQHADAKRIQELAREGKSVDEIASTFQSETGHFLSTGEVEKTVKALSRIEPDRKAFKEQVFRNWTPEKKKLHATALRMAQRPSYDTHWGKPEENVVVDGINYSVLKEEAEKLRNLAKQVGSTRRQRVPSIQRLPRTYLDGYTPGDLITLQSLGLTEDTIAARLSVKLDKDIDLESLRSNLRRLNGIVRTSSLDDLVNRTGADATSIETLKRSIVDEQGAASIDVMAPIAGSSSGAIVGYNNPIDLDGDGEFSDEERYISAFSFGGLGGAAAGALSKGPKALSRMDNTEAYVFGGINAKKPNLPQLENAKNMQQHNLPSAQIKKETGWHQLPDGKWRFEIDDSEMTVDPGLKKILSGINDGTFKNRVGRLPLGKVIKNKALFEQYPDLAEIKVHIDPKIDITAGYSRSEDQIVLGKRGIALSDDQLEQVIVHEIQHAVQAREKFTLGANASNPLLLNSHIARETDPIIEALPASDLVKEKFKNTAEMIMQELERGTSKDPHTLFEITRGILGDKKTLTHDQFNFFMNDLIQYSKKYLLAIEKSNARIDRENQTLGRAVSDQVANYQRVLGEIEARMASARKNIPSNQRNNLPIEDELDIAYGGTGQTGRELFREALDANGRPIK